jgi:hypothetical protein
MADAVLAGVLQVTVLGSERMRVREGSRPGQSVSPEELAAGEGPPVSWPATMASMVGAVLGQEEGVPHDCWLGRLGPRAEERVLGRGKEILFFFRN